MEAPRKLIERKPAMLDERRGNVNDAQRVVAGALNESAGNDLVEKIQAPAEVLGRTRDFFARTPLPARANDVERVHVATIGWPNVAHDAFDHATRFLNRTRAGGRPVLARLLRGSPHGRARVCIQLFHGIYLAVAKFRAPEATFLVELVVYQYAFGGPFADEEEYGSPDCVVE